MKKYLTGFLFVMSAILVTEFCVAKPTYAISPAQNRTSIDSYYSWWLHGTRSLPSKMLTSTEYIQNGDFESGDFMDWTTTGNPRIDTTYMHGGSDSAQLVRKTGDPAISAFAQIVSVPVSAISTNFSYWYAIHTNGPVNGTIHFAAKVCEGTCSPLTTLFSQVIDLSTAGTVDWTQVPVDLSAAAGKTVTITFAISSSVPNQVNVNIVGPTQKPFLSPFLHTTLFVHTS